MASDGQPAIYEPAASAPLGQPLRLSVAGFQQYPLESHDSTLLRRLPPQVTLLFAVDNAAQHDVNRTDCDHLASAFSRYRRSGYRPHPCQESRTAGESTQITAVRLQLSAGGNCLLSF